MTTAYTSLLGLALPVTGELSGTWGDTVNTAITSLLDTAVAGTTSITTDADITLTTTTGASNQARQAIILWNPASGTTTRNITAPAQSKMYTVINASGGTQSIVIRGAGPTTGVTVLKGESALVAWNGSDFVKVSSIGGAGTFTNLTVTGNTILGDAIGDTLTVNATTSFTAPVNLPSTGRSAAAALTPTNPAFLYGVASTYTDTTSSGTLSPVATFYSLARPTLSTSNVTTYTNAATLYIANSPAAAGSATITNPYALYVAAGAAFFGGGISGSTVINDGTVNGVAYLNGSKVLTTGAEITYNGTTFTAPFTNLSANGVVLTVDRIGTGNNDRTNVQFSNAGTVRGGIGTVGASNGIYFNEGTTEGMRLTSAGLSIKTTVSNDPLTVNGLARFIDGSDTRKGSIRFSSGGFNVQSDETELNLNAPSSYVAIYTGASGTGFERLRVGPTGLVGIGTTAPGSILEVAGVSPVDSTGSSGKWTLRLRDTTATAVAGTGAGLLFQGIKATGGGVGNYGAIAGLKENSTNNNENGYLGFFTVSNSNGLLAERGRFSSAGNLMLGTTSDQNRRLQVNGAIGLVDSALNSVGDMSIDSSGNMAISPYNGGGSTLIISTSPSGGGVSERVRVTSTGRVGIGQSNPQSTLGFGTLATITWGTTNYPFISADQGVNSISFGTQATERVRIDSSGNFAVGNGTTATNTQSASVFFGNFGTVLGSGISIGGACISGISGASNWFSSTSLGFYTNPGPDVTSTGAVERMRLTGPGNLGIGTTSPNYRVDVYTNNSADAVRLMRNSVPGTGAGPNLDFSVTQTNSQSARLASIGTEFISAWGGALIFYTKPQNSNPDTTVNERARITENGTFLIGATGTDLSATVGWGCNASGGGGTTVSISNTNEAFTYNNLSTAGTAQIDFRTANIEKGNISWNNSSTTYNTSSDYRLKNSIAPMTGALAKVALLKPCTYKWNADGSDGEGFIAHELAEVVPQCVTGKKDAVREDGVTPRYQGIDTSFLVATLTAAIQEQQVIIESLKARLDAANL